MKFYLGIDPGKSGAFALVDQDGQPVSHIHANEPPAAIGHWMADSEWAGAIDFAVLERVSSSPQMGVKSAFTFGESYGIAQGILGSTETRFELVTPYQWQKAMKCVTRGDKGVTRDMACRLFPSVRITHQIADAYLIAEYCRRVKLIAKAN